MHMHSILRRLAAALSLFLVSSLAAQSVTVNPGVELRVGQNASIAIENTRYAGRTVMLVITGDSPGQSVDIAVALDSNGKGTTSWTVPSGWTNAYFQAPGCPNVAVPVL